MRNRRIQRELDKRGIAVLGKRDACGVVDSVAYEAMLRWKREVVMEMRKKYRDETIKK